MPYGKSKYGRKNYPRGNRGYKRRNFTRVPAKKIPFSQKKALTRAVAIEVAKGRENKYGAWVQRPTTIPAIIGKNQVLNIQRVLPYISQGIGEYGNRVGNKINPKSMVISGWCTLDMTDETTDYDRVAVRIMVGFPKRYPLYEDAEQAVTAAPLDNWTYKILDYGNGPGAFEGTLSSFQAPHNVDVWTMKAERKFTLMRPRIWDSITATSDFARSTAGSFKFFKMKIPVPHQMEFGQATDIQPKNFAPTLLCGYTLLNGALPGDPTTAPKQVTISYTTRLSYEDA